MLTSQQQKQSHAAENSQYSAHSSFVFQNSDIFHQMQRVQSDEGDRLQYPIQNTEGEIRFFPPASSTFVESKAAQKNRVGLIKTDED